MRSGYCIQHVGDPRGPFVATLKEALDEVKQKTDDLNGPYNLRRGHTWVWGPDRTRGDAFQRMHDRLAAKPDGFGLVVRGRRDDHITVARNRKWAIWSIVELEGPAVIQRAVSLMGLRYIFGGVSEALGLDCSGLTLDCVYRETGILLPHGADLQYRDDRVETFQDVTKAKPGDLVPMWFPNSRGIAPDHASHIGFYLSARDGTHYMIDTRSSFEPVGIRPIELNSVLAYGRLEEVNGPLL